VRKILQSKFPDRPHVLKTTLMFVEDNKICDGCDEHVRCASLSLLGGGVAILCEDCITGILEELNPSTVRDIKLNKILK